MNKITAKIKKDKQEKGLWLFVEFENKNDNYAWPIEEEEIEPIMEACFKWIEKTGATKQIL